MFYDINFDENLSKLFSQMGLEVEILLKDAGIPHRAVQDGKLQLSVEQYKALVGAMDKHIAPQNILSFSIIDSISTFIPEFFAGLCAENGLTCVNRISKYKKIVAPVQMNVRENDNQVIISYIYNDGTPMPDMLVAHAQLSILSIIRKGTGNESIKPLKISKPLEYHENIVEYVGINPTAKSDGNEIVFNIHDLEIPFITTNNKIWDYLESELNQRLRDIEMDESFSAVVRKTLIELLPAGICDAENISRELAISKRTLQRRLKDEGTTFNKQLNHTRELMVRNYLKMDVPLDEIAFLVSYSDAKSLSRAFKTWTGLNVSDYRKQYQ